MSVTSLLEDDHRKNLTQLVSVFKIQDKEKWIDFLKINARTFKKI